MQRRAFLAGGAAALSLGLARRARAADVHRLGYISTSTTDPNSPYLLALREGLKAHGYEEGRNLVIEYRFGRSRDELPAMAADLVALPVELIVAGGSEGIVAAKDATRTIPIVMANSGDAVREGFARSLGKPGGNITGMTQISPELVGKRLEMLREIFRDLKRVGILWNPVHPNTPFEFDEARIATETLGLEPHAIEAREPDDIRRGLEREAQRGVRAFLVIRDPFMVRNRVAIARALDELHLAAVFETSDFVDAGGMMYYGPDFADLFRRSAAFVDKILRGARPADLPIEQPARFKMVINKRVAERRGIDLPRTLLIRADEVIE